MGDIIWKSAFNFFSLRLYSFKSPGRDIRVLGKMSCPITLQPDCTTLPRKMLTEPHPLAVISTWYAECWPKLINFPPIANYFQRRPLAQSFLS